MFGETTRPSNEQTRPYTARIREWEISLSRPSPVARRRLRHSLYVRIVCRTSPCNVYMEYRYPRGSCVQTSPPGTQGLLLVSQCCGENSRYLPLPSVCLVGRSVGLTIICNAIWEKQRFAGFNGVTYLVSLWLFDSTRQRVPQSFGKTHRMNGKACIFEDTIMKHQQEFWTVCTTPLYRFRINGRSQFSLYAKIRLYEDFLMLGRSPKLILMVDPLMNLQWIFLNGKTSSKVDIRISSSILTL